MLDRLIYVRVSTMTAIWTVGHMSTTVHTDERTQVHSAHSSLTVTHPSANRVRRYLTSVTEAPMHAASIGRHCGPHKLWKLLTATHGPVR